MDTRVLLSINGQKHTVTTDPDRPLLSVLREDLHLTGTRFGCGQGDCAACTVLVNGARTYSCQLPVGQAQGAEITTIEGLARGDTLHPVQQAYLDEGAYQCGYCVSGMIMSTVALLAEKPHPTDEEITAWMDRHLCRCCGYMKITRAIKRAAGTTGGAQ